MGEITRIEWTDRTFNPWIGCTKVDAACAHCYAEREDHLHKWTLDGWGKGNPRYKTSPGNWKGPVHWQFDAAREGRRIKVFCASLADWLDEEAPVEWLVELLALIRLTPDLDWQLLTKRPQNFLPRINAAMKFIEDHAPRAGFDELHEWLLDWVAPAHNKHLPANVWIGVSAGTRLGCGQRIAQALRIPARVRFLSCEPMLEAIDLRALYAEVTAVPGIIGQPGCEIMRTAYSALECGVAIPGKLDWVICGGESGPHARPMHPDWARGLRDQCAQAGVPFFFKQWGEWLPDMQFDGHRTGKPIPSGTIVRCIDGLDLYRVGKRAAGWLLDGVEHHAFPSATFAISFSNPRGGGE